MVVFYTDAVKTLGELLPLGLGVSSLDKLADTCAKIMEAASRAPPLQRVAAISLMSAIAQVGPVFHVAVAFIKTLFFWIFFQL